MKVSASIYSSTNKPLVEVIRELDQYRIDYFHIDCRDNMDVFKDIATIRTMSKTPVDLHIITPTPEKYYEKIAEAKVEFVTFQYENLGTMLQIPDYVKSSMGLAIVSETPVDVFAPYADKFDFMLFMATTPGVSGQSFNKDNFRKIRAFKKLFPDKTMEVDGGVNAEVSFILRNMGVDSAVVGSYLFTQETLGMALLNLKSNKSESHYIIKDFMVEANELPVLNEHEVTFESALTLIDKYALGFVLVVNDENILSGMITNADVRKGLLRNINNLNGITKENITNRNPLSIQQNKTITELLNLIKHSKFPVSYLPVVDEKNRLTGALTFNNLIKGEL
jgi:pentose-5-phosphate-3-epimerase/CBS domain-containing protein